MLNPRPLRDDVRELLRNRICDQHFQPGASLSPADLAKQFSVSPTPMREALIELARDGLIENSPNRGFLIRPLSIAEVTEIYPLIAELEAIALRLAPPTAEQLEELVEINADYNVAEGLVTVDDDRDWHRELLKACPNRTLMETIDHLRWRIRRYEIAYLKTGARWSPQAAVQHHAMVLALRRGDVTRGAELLSMNWKEGETLVTSFLNS